jgi:hypothetical protein
MFSNSRQCEVLKYLSLQDTISAICEFLDHYPG